VIPLLALALAQAAEPAALLEQARRAEREGRPADEVAACTELLALEAGGGPARVCEERLAWLAAREDPGGGFQGLTRLEQGRRGGELEPVAQDPSVSPTVRAEASVALSSRALAEDPTLALHWTEAWWPGEALPAQTRVLVGRARLRALIALGREDEARAVDAALGQSSSSAQVPLRLARREQIGRLSGLGAAAWALPSLPLALIGWRRAPRPRPLGLLPLALVGLGSLGLAVAWERSLLAPFAMLLAGLLLSHLLAAGGALALQSRPVWRGLYGLASALGTGALALFLMQRGDLLSWLGL